MSSSYTRLRPSLALAILIVGVVAVLSRLTFQTDPRPSSATVTPDPLLATLTENGVRVRISFETDPSGSAWLIGTFTPLQANFHLYSKDLPRDGIQGQGRPTLLELISPAEVKPIGALIADQPLVGYYSRALEQALPVYPDGMVTLRQMIQRPAGRPAVSTSLSITYMACSDQVCLPPVANKEIVVTLPAVIR